MATVEGATSATADTGAASTRSPTPSTASGSLTFRQFLSDINPLQYIPVVGAVYRAVTGDEGNSTLRFVASLGTSFALGGPLGVGITVAEKITGIDPERIARSLLSGMFHHGVAAASATPATQAATAPATTTSGSGDAANRPWSAAELSAYAAATGGLSSAGPGGAVTADTLNAMELKRVNTLYA